MSLRWLSELYIIAGQLESMNHEELANQIYSVIDELTSPVE